MPQSVNAEVGLLKWGEPRYRDQLRARFGVDYAAHPAEDFATGIVTFAHPDTGQRVKGQFTVSWMYDKQGLRLLLDGIGPGYALEANSLQSPLEIFIGDAAAAGVADAELALEKSTASQGLLAVQPNEPDLYGYVDENEDAVRAFRAGRSGGTRLGLRSRNRPADDGGVSVGRRGSRRRSDGSGHQRAARTVTCRSFSRGAVTTCCGAERTNDRSNQ